MINTFRGTRGLLVKKAKNQKQAARSDSGVESYTKYNNFRIIGAI